MNTSNNATAGNYNLFFEEWRVPALAPGATAELTLVLFALQSSASVKMFSEVTASDQPDPDSTPGNGNGQTPQEDDEVQATITVTNNFTNDDPSTNLQAAQVSPNVVSSGQNVRLSTFSNVPTDATLRILDQSGQVRQQQTISLPAGENSQRLVTKSLPAGIYLVQVQIAGDATLTTQRLIVQ